MKIVVDLLRALLLSILFLFMFMIKLLRNFLNWAIICMDRVMKIGENGLEAEMVKVKGLIKNIIQEVYQKIKS